MENKKLSNIDKDLNDLETELNKILETPNSPNINIERLSEIFDQIDNQIANINFEDDTKIN
jgi:hypothetical protein